MQKIARSSFIPWNRRAVAVAFGDYNAYIYVYLVRRHRYYHHLHQHHHHRRRRGVAAYIVRRCDVYISVYRRRAQPTTGSSFAYKLCMLKAAHAFRIWCVRRGLAEGATGLFWVPSH